MAIAFRHAIFETIVEAKYPSVTKETAKVYTLV